MSFRKAREKGIFLTFNLKHPPKVALDICRFLRIITKFYSRFITRK
jgi:hypothetical protein